MIRMNELISLADHCVEQKVDNSSAKVWNEAELCMTARVDYGACPT
jgi:hypothetical protein